MLAIKNNSAPEAVNRDHSVVITPIAGMEGPILLHSHILCLRGMDGKLGSAETISQSTCTWPVPHGTFRVDRLLQW